MSGKSNLWTKLALAMELPEREITLWGGDIDTDCVRLTEENAVKAGVGDCLFADCQTKYVPYDVINQKRLSRACITRKHEKLVVTIIIPLFN